MKRYRIKDRDGNVLWQGAALSADFAIVRAYKSLGYETFEQWQKSGVYFVEVVNDDE